MTRKDGFTIAEPPRGSPRQKLHERALNRKGKLLFCDGPDGSRGACCRSSPKASSPTQLALHLRCTSLQELGLKMYSNSSSYLGGGNSARPGQPHYGQTPYSNFQQGQQQPGGLAPQPTGFGNAPLQPQYTGYPPQAQQPGFQNQQQQQQQYTGLPQQNQPPLQQQTFQTGQAPQSQIQQRTGQTSSQIAQSFQGTPATPTPAAQPTVAGTKIPKIRLSFLTAQDQAKFEQLFKSAVGEGQALDGTTKWDPWKWDFADQL